MASQLSKNIQWLESGEGLALLWDASHSEPVPSGCSCFFLGLDGGEGKLIQSGDSALGPCVLVPKTNPVIAFELKYLLCFFVFP